MRDIILAAIIFPACIAALRRPWIGVMLWTWLSIMNPHRYTFGFAINAPWAAMAAACTMLGFVMTKDRTSPIKGSPVVWFILLILWMTLTWLVGLDVKGDYEQWVKVMKIDVMLVISLMLLHSRMHVFAFMWVTAGSLGLLGIKGGIFTLIGGGAERVWGPPGSFIEDNNEFALALVATIPLLRFLQMHAQSRIVKWGLVGAMLLSAAAALGSHSRGALLAIAAMAAAFWWRSKKSRAKIGVVIGVLAVGLLAFMPAEWTARMETIEDYQHDGSAMGRINAWTVAWNIGLRYPFGVGFNPMTPELFEKYALFPRVLAAAHSIYFQMMGNHGLIGLAIFMGIWISTWLTSGWLRTQKNLTPETQWTADMGAMCQVSLVGFLVGGAFLSLAYFDLPYNIMVMVVVTRAWVVKKGWTDEPATCPKWMNALGLSQPKKAN